MNMKKIYIAPTTCVSSHAIPTFLHTISNSSLNGGSSNGGSSADGSSGPGVEKEDQELGSDGFAKHRGFYSGFSD